MRKLDIKYDIFNPDSSEFPEAKMEILDTECYHCKARTRHQVPVDLINYKQVADDYKELADEMLRSINQMIQDINVMHSDNPVLEYINNQREIMVAGLRAVLENAPTEPAKEGE